MTQTAQHYDRPSLAADLPAMLAQAFPDGRRLTPVDLAPLDQFHLRGIHATVELAERAGVARDTRVLDVGSGIGGPARVLAATYGCRVTGIDLSPSFVEAARLLNERTGLGDLVTFEVGDATQLAFADASFDCVTLHHVAMNVADRDALYAGIARVLRPGGTFVTYDVVRRADDLLYPVPWARSGDRSFVITEDATREALTRHGFTIASWRDETPIATAWFAAAAGASPPANGLSLARLIGPDFVEMTANFQRNLAEGRAGVIAAIATR